MIKKSIAIIVALSFALAGCGHPQYLGEGTAQRYNAYPVATHKC